MQVRDILSTRRLLDIPRDLAAHLGNEAVDVNRRGDYVSPSGRTVSIARTLDHARSSTVEYAPDHPWPAPPPRSGRTPAIEVANETTLSAARRLLDDGVAPTALNFASATSPGGGFLTGARAQEEYLARSSGLHACLEDRDMYAASRARLDPFYDDWVIHSPDVPVFRDDTGAFVEEPWICGILTSPAVQANGVRKYRPEREGEIEAVMRRRLRCVLAAASAHDARALVLGAWGCGAFGNDTSMIARLFREELDAWAAAFDRVVFAVTDWSPERRFIGPFEAEFGRARA
ncbi:MAG: TIGR02452 family protein [Alphaproteobacteria bacterium]